MVTIKKTEIEQASSAGGDTLFLLISNAIKESISHELNASTMNLLNGCQNTILAYAIFREEVLNGGFVQLIQNGYGPYIFDNPFARSMRMMGVKELSKLLDKAKDIYRKNKTELETDYSYDDFMALYERFEQFDAIEEQFEEADPVIIEAISAYIKENLDDFVDQIV